MTIPEVLTESVSIQVGDGKLMAGYLARPDGPVARAVIVGMELFGLSAHVRDVCDRLAALGFVALAPDLYHRDSPGVELAADAHGRAKGFDLLGGLNQADVLDDIGATMAFLENRRLTVVGMVGISVGGHVAYLAAANFDLPATVVLYGGWLTSTAIPLSRPEPTISQTARIRGRVLFLVGELDALISAEDCTRIDRALAAAGVDHQLIRYPGAGHAFACDRRSSFHEPSAADAWGRIEQFLSI